MKDKKKDGSFIVRASDDEKQKIKAKVQEAGYKSVGAFVRDYIINCKPKVKSSINLDVLKVQKELMNLASMINADQKKDELIRQIKVISAITLGGVQ